MSTATEHISTATKQQPIQNEWPSYKRIAFRIAFVFLVIFCIPTKDDWFIHLFHIDWAHLHCRDLYDIVRYAPEFISPSREARWGIGGYINWGILLIASIVIGLIWTLLDQKRKEYTTLYHWLRLLVRYRAAVGLIGFSFEKVFPTQMPYPSLANLSADFGDFDGHKVFWTSIGIVPWFQFFGGLTELVPGLLLLHRRTATLGAVLCVAVLLTITFINLGNDGGVHVYATYFVVLGLFLLLNDIPAIYRLLVEEKPATLINAWPELSTKRLQYISYGVKTVILIYTVVFGYLFYLNFRFDPYKQPSVAGVPTLKGYYDVVEFKVNNKAIPHSPLDSVRWQDVTFEDWSTLTFKVNRKFSTSTAGGRSSSNTGHSSIDLEKGYEVSGVGGGRRAFHYYADTITQTLYLQDKKKSNKKDPYPKDWIGVEAWKHIGDDNHKINPRAWSTRRDRDFEQMDKTVVRDKMKLSYSTVDGSKVILTGTDENRDSVYIVLQKTDKNYILSRSNYEAGTYK